MILKRGVVLALGASMARALNDLDTVVLAETGFEMVITCASDGVHMAGSKHYTGEAIDIRTSNLDALQKVRLRNALAVVLGKWFDVVIEPDHLHIEFDPR